MEFQEVVRRRRMVRNFRREPIPPDVLERILENALHAPSAGFSQGWAFLVLSSEDERALFWDSQGEYGTVGNAPVLIVCLSHKDAYLDRYAEADKGWTDRDEARWPTPYWDVDTGFAALMMLLTAVDAGLGALFFGIHELDALRSAFGIPGGYHPIGVIAVGYTAPDERSPSLRRGRRPRSDVVHRGAW